MTLSPDTELALQMLEEKSTSGLRKRNDLGTLLECGATSGSFEKVNEAVFLGAAVWNLYSALRKSEKGADGFSLLEREFAEHMNKLRETVASLISEVDEPTFKRFEDIYFGMTSGVIKNVVDLGHDLAVLKNMQNTQRHS